MSRNQFPQIDPAVRPPRNLWLRGLLAFFGAALLAGGMVLLTRQDPQPVAWLVGEAVAVFLGIGLLARSAVLAAAARPTVQCAGCGAVGRSADVVRHQGRCARCGGQRFFARGRFRRGSGGKPATASGANRVRRAFRGGMLVAGRDIVTGDFMVTGEAAPRRGTGADGAD
ncbi:MAG: hypothetical protein H6843_14600 [Rhodospirillaceae bacterium]|nr:hypothetical protein [Rhodospirillaceae bacterium]